jgi:hypothetical protein
MEGLSTLPGLTTLKEYSGDFALSDEVKCECWLVLVPITAMYWTQISGCDPSDSSLCVHICKASCGNLSEAKV